MLNKALSNLELKLKLSLAALTLLNNFIIIINSGSILSCSDGPVGVYVGVWVYELKG